MKCNIYICIYIYIYIYIYVCVYVYICMYVCIHMCISKYLIVSLESTTKFHVMYVMSWRNVCSHATISRSFVSQKIVFQMHNS